MQPSEPERSAAPSDPADSGLRVVEGGSARAAARRARRRQAERAPFVTYLLLASVIALFALMFSAGNGDVGSVARQFGDKDNALIRAGQWWRFLTPVFLHGSVVHLLSNALMLYWFGTQLELLYGWRKFLLLYLLSGVAGNLASFWMSPAPSVGASGALFGLVGAGLVYPVRFHAYVPARARRIILRQLGMIVLINLAIGFSPGSRVDNWAHLGGLAGGALLALFLIPDGLEERPRPVYETIISLLLVATLAALGLAGYRQWQWFQQNRAPQLSLQLQPAGPDPWWSIKFPDDWRRKGLELHSPEGAVVTIEDIALRSPEQVEPYLETLLGPLLRDGVRPAPTLLDGKPAFHLVWSRRDVRRVNDMVLLPAQNHVLLIRLEADAAIYAKSQKVYRLILSSLRIVHAPPLPPAR